MRTRAILTSIFASLSVLVIGWQLGAAATQANSSITLGASGAPAVRPGAGTAGPSTATGGSPTPAPTTGSPAPAAPHSPDGTYTGSSVDTRFGSVQVQVTVSGGQISDVTPLHLTDADGRSVQISNRAAPVLAQEVLAAQSANVSNVSGATYTSQAYLTSVQSALDQAGL